MNRGRTLFVRNGIHNIGSPVGLALLAALFPAMSTAQTAYRHRDASGQWVFTDQAASPTAAGDSFELTSEPGKLHISVDRTDTGASTELVAVNDCLCVVTFDVQITSSSTEAFPAGTHFRKLLEQQTRATLASGPRIGRTAFQYRWRAALGSPEAAHNPTRPYRVPFAIGSTYVISQAYPSHITHTTRDSEYAVDIALPDETAVYSAREGTVINVRHDSFRGAPAPAMLDQANVVEILHDDGTIALYAHLHWDSIRVRIGQHVVRGQYIANSGNTGFSSGPHLHFAVIRNSGESDVSVPVEFAGRTGAVEPVTRMALTAY